MIAAQPHTRAGRMAALLLTDFDLSRLHRLARDQTERGAGYRFASDVESLYCNHDPRTHDRSLYSQRIPGDFHSPVNIGRTGASPIVTTDGEMAGFDNPLQTWNARYAREDYHFGEEPNAFLSAHTHLLKAGQSALCVADGEGRNSSFLAEHGIEVTAFDFAPNAVVKAKRLAARRGVRVDHRIGDIFVWDWTSSTYNLVVAIFIQFLSPVDREPVFAGMKAAIKPGGLLLLEGYRPEQVDYGTGGPPRRENMYTLDWLAATFSGWEILETNAYDAAIHEGQGHDGMSALIDLVARKPATR